MTDISFSFESGVSAFSGVIGAGTIAQESAYVHSGTYGAQCSDGLTNDDGVYALLGGTVSPTDLPVISVWGERYSAVTGYTHSEWGIAILDASGNGHLFRARPTWDGHISICPVSGYALGGATSRVDSTTVNTVYKLEISFYTSSGFWYAQGKIYDSSGTLIDTVGPVSTTSSHSFDRVALWGPGWYADDVTITNVTLAGGGTVTLAGDAAMQPDAAQ